MSEPATRHSSPGDIRCQPNSELVAPITTSLSVHLLSEPEPATLVPSRGFTIVVIVRLRHNWQLEDTRWT
jgi:hypothetical protein